MDFHSVWVLLTCISTDVYTKDIIVSQRQHSQDVPSCGSKAIPCRTLEYSISQKSIDGDTVLLDGGTNTRFSYEIKKPLVIRKVVTIKSSSNIKPNIMSGNCFMNTLFDIQANVVFESITMSRFKFGIVLRNNVSTINVTSCDFNTFQKLFENKSSRMVHFQIKNSTFGNYHHAIEIPSNIILVVTATRFLGSDTYQIFCNQSFAQVAISLLPNNTRDKFNVQIMDTSFENCSSAIRMVDNIKGNLSITSCSFKNNHLRLWHRLLFENYNSNLFVTGNMDVSISESQFIGNMAMKGGALQIQCPATMSLTNNTFLKNSAVHEGGAIHLNSFRAQMMNNVFEGNVVNPAIYETIIPGVPQKFYASSKDGGAVWNSGNLTIINGTFNENTAPAFGGSIYHTSSCQGNYALYMQNSTIDGPKHNLSYVGSLVYSNALLSLQNVVLNVFAAKNYGSVLYYYGVVNTKLRQGSRMLHFSLKCPQNYKLSSEKIDDKDGNYFSLVYFCSVCDKGTYSLDNEHEIFNSESSEVFVKNTIKCHKCPSGAICNYGIICNDNFYGYADKENFTHFLQCPPSYCCSVYGKNCTSYNTCAFNRQGMLCGKCSEGYSENVVSAGCVKNEMCGQFWFWMLFFTLAICYFNCIIYLKDFIKWFNRILKNEESVESKRELLIPRRCSTSSDSFLEDELGTELDRSHQSRYIEERSTFTMSGILKIVLFFYQVELLLHVNAASKKHFKMFSFWKDLALSIFNIKPSFHHNMLVLCPSPNMDAVEKEFIKILFIACIFGILLIAFVIHNVLLKFCQKPETLSQEHVHDKIEVIDVYIPLYKKIPFKLRLKCGFLQLILFCYTPVTTSMFRFINCVQMNDSKLLYINAEVQCYEWWQYVSTVVLAVWILPLCLALYWSIMLLKECKIRPNEFLKGLIFPPLVLLYFIKWRIYREHGFLSTREARDSRHLLQVFSEPFRHKYAKWEGMILLRRIILTILYVFLINPVVRLYIMFFFLALFLLDHLRTQPYRGKFLNWLETVSLMLLVCFAAINLFWAEGYMYDVVPQSFMLGEVFLMLEVIVLVLPGVLLLVALIFMCVKKVYFKCRKRI